MSKRRKTRQQKIISDLRHQLIISSPSVFTFQRANEQIKTTTNEHLMQSAKTVSLYTYNPADIIKTGIVTGILILVEILLLFFLKNHVITIPGVSF